MKYKILCVVCLLLSSVSYCYSQTTLSVTNEKIGKLGKMIDKGAFSTVKELKISGTLDNKDLVALAQFSSLEKLDLSEATLIEDNYDSEKRPYYKDSRGLDLSFCRHLKTLIFNTNKGDEKSLLFGSLPNTLKELHIGGENYRLSNFEKLFDKGIRLDKVVVASTPADEWRYRYRYKIESSKPGLYIRNLVLPSKEAIGRLYVYHESRVCIRPTFIHCTDEDFTLLRHWEPSVTNEELLEVDSLCEEAFGNTAVTDVVLPKKIKEIPAYCFYKCSNLKSVKADGVEKISYHAFDESSISEITLPASLKKLDVTAFQNSPITKVSFLGDCAPELYRTEEYKLEYAASEYEAKSNILFYIPKGTMKYYNLGPWKNRTLVEEGTINKYEFSVKNPGTLAEQLTDEIASKVLDLTLKGFLYDIDFDAIKKCKDLRSIDLGDCVIVKSPETLKKEKAESEAMIAFFGAFLQMAKEETRNKYNAGKASLGDVLQTEVFDMLFSQSAAKPSTEQVSQISDKTFIPDVFGEFLYLERVVFPKFMKKLTFYHKSEYLKEVVLPTNVEHLVGSLAGPTKNYSEVLGNKIKKIELPSTLKTVDGMFFKGCYELECLDFSKTDIEKLSPKEYILPKCRTFKASPKMKEVSIMCHPNCEYYFYTLERPIFFYPGDKCTIHIPKGSKAGWNGIESSVLVDDVILE